VGSGEHTSKGLSREEAAEALDLMLHQEATPAQIGAFLIAHRIRRPEPQELTGMLDTYRQLGPKLHSKTDQTAPVCFCMPFDGRSRTAPVYPLTTLVLLALRPTGGAAGRRSHANQIRRNRYRSVSRTRC
jgi:anthranilate phosphoribosyltransferase